MFPKHWGLGTIRRFTLFWNSKFVAFHFTNSSFFSSADTGHLCPSSVLTQDSHSSSAMSLHQNLQSLKQTCHKCWVTGKHIQRQLCAEFRSLILCLKQNKQTGRAQGQDEFTNFGWAQATELMTSVEAICNHWHWGKAQVTPVQSGIKPGSGILACVTAAQFSNLDSNPFGNPPVQWGPTCKALAVLKSAHSLERKAMFCSSCNSPTSFLISLFFDHLTDHDRQIPRYSFACNVCNFTINILHRRQVC